MFSSAQNKAVKNSKYSWYIFGLVAKLASIKIHEIKIRIAVSLNYYTLHHKKPYALLNLQTVKVYKEKTYGL